MDPVKVFFKYVLPALILVFFAEYMLQAGLITP